MLKLESNKTYTYNDRIIKVCDKCDEEKEVAYGDAIRSRNREYNFENKDFCYSCAMKIFNERGFNPAKKSEVRKKISEKTKGRSKTFKDGKNLRILGRKVNTAGYILIYNEQKKEYVFEHRQVMENKLNRELYEDEVVHHVDGDKKNNKIKNLINLSKRDHDILHSQLGSLALDLVKKDIILFNGQKYFLNPQLQIKSMPVSLGFEDVAIQQKKNICNSRLDVDISSEIIRGVKLEVPLIASNMSTVCDAEFCIDLYINGCLGVMHRAVEDDFIYAEVKKIASECEWVAASIGVGFQQFDFAAKLIMSGANIIFIDIAHGYSDAVIKLAKSIKKTFSHVKLVLGNTTNVNMLYEIYDFADAIKVGIAQGFACETKNTAGCTEKQFSSILKFKEISKQFGIPVIGDGGIRECADVVKAIGAGAGSIMAGKIFAACPESAAELLEIDGKKKKVYAGMASRYVQNRWKGKLKDGTCPEGGVRYLDLGESLGKLVERYSGALKSGITYAGGKDIRTFQDNVEFIRI